MKSLHTFTDRDRFYVDRRKSSRVKSFHSTERLSEGHGVNNGPPVSIRSLFQFKIVSAINDSQVDKSEPNE